MSDYPSHPESLSPRGFWSLPPSQQITYGCLVVVVITLGILYCAGTFSLMVRPSLQRPPTATLLARPTQTATTTRAPVTLIVPPRGTLVPTPTQAPIPTRELPTLTPTVDLTNPAPSVTITGTRATLTITSTRRIITAVPPLTITSRP